MANDKLRTQAAHLNNVEVIEALRTNKDSEHWKPCVEYLLEFLAHSFRTVPLQTREDVAQEAALLIHRNFLTFRRDSTFTTWATHVAHNAMIDLLRKQKGMKAMEMQVYDQSDEAKEVLNLIASGEDPVEYVLNQERIQEFRTLLEEFLSKRRKAGRDREILRKILQGYSYQEIADEQGVQPTVVSAVLYSFRRFAKEQPYGGMPNK